MRQYIPNEMDMLMKPPVVTQNISSMCTSLFVYMFQHCIFACSVHNVNLSQIIIILYDFSSVQTLFLGYSFNIVIDNTIENNAILSL